MKLIVLILILTQFLSCYTVVTPKIYKRNISIPDYVTKEQIELTKTFFKVINTLNPINILICYDKNSTFIDYLIPYLQIYDITVRTKRMIIFDELLCINKKTRKYKFGKIPNTCILYIYCHKNNNHIENKSYLEQVFTSHRVFYIKLIENSNDELNLSLLEQNFRYLSKKSSLNNIIIIYYEKNTTHIYTYVKWPPLKSYLKKISKNITKTTILDKSELFPTVHGLPNFNKTQKLSIAVSPLEEEAILVNEGEINERYIGEVGHLAEIIIELFNAKKHIFYLDSYVRYDDLALIREPSYFDIDLLFAFTQYHDDYCILLPSDGLVSPFWNVLKCFQKETWFAVILTFSIICIILKLLNHNEKQSILIPFGILTEKSIQLHKNTKWYTKYIIGVWILGCLIITNAFKTYLITYVMRASVSKVYHTLDDIKGKNITFKYDVSMLHFMRYYNFSPNFNDLKIKPETGSDIKSLLKEANSNYGYFLENSAILNYIYVTSDIIQGQKVAKFYKLNQCLFPMYTTYFNKPSWPYWNFFNVLLLKTQETGLHSYWNSESKFYHIIKASIKHSKQHRSTNYLDSLDLEMQHMSFAFFILIIGYIFGLIVFIIEMQFN